MYSFKKRSTIRMTYLFGIIAANLNVPYKYYNFYFIIIFFLSEIKMEVIKINSVKNKTNCLYTLQLNRL